MTTTEAPTATTCAELYHCHPTFAAGIATWVANRRCPLELGDLLEDLGFPTAADCARWAASEPDRPAWGTAGRLTCGPYPTLSTSGSFYWMYTDTLIGDEGGMCDFIFSDRAGEVGRRPLYHDSVPEALLWLLDNWKPRDAAD